MPMQYQRDDLRRRVVITYPGRFAPADALAAIERHHAEGVWGYGVLYDLRQLRGLLPAIADLKAHMERDAQRPIESSEPRGPVAIVTPDPIVYDIACTYAAIGRATMMTIQVFRDRTDAETWLTAQTNREADA
jgi:hypothetical protein